MIITSTARRRNEDDLRGHGVLALVNARDEYHERAKAATRNLEGRLITTTWVLTEVADAFCRPGQRETAAALLNDLQSDPQVTIVPPSMDLYLRALALYADRSDKAWSLTDCVSFVVMRGLSEALASDRDFEQAGFVALLK